MEAAVVAACAAERVPRSKLSVLVLDGRRAATGGKGLEGLVGLEELSLVNCGITSLDGFPSLPRLRVLGLSDNAVSTGLGALAGACPLLAAVDLSNNKVKAVSELRALAPLRHLERLSVDGCPVGFAGGPGVSADQVRAAIFSALPTLRVLDGADAHGNEVDEEDEEDEGEGEEGEEGGEGDEDEGEEGDAEAGVSDEAGGGGDGGGEGGDEGGDEEGEGEEEGAEGEGGAAPPPAAGADEDDDEEEEGEEAELGTAFLIDGDAEALGKDEEFTGSDAAPPSEDLEDDADDDGGGGGGGGAAGGAGRGGAAAAPPAGKRQRQA